MFEVSIFDIEPDFDGSVGQCCRIRRIIEIRR